MKHDFRIIKKVIVVLAVFAVGTITAQTQGFLGSYWYTKTEFSEQIHILKQHRFSWQYVYGARNVDLRGKWKIKKDTLHFLFDKIPNQATPREIVAVLNDSGKLKLLRRYKKSYQESTVLTRFQKTLPLEKAEKWAKPIDYKKQVAEQKQRLKKAENPPRKGKYDGFFKSDKDEKIKAIEFYDYGYYKNFAFGETKPNNEGKFIGIKGSFTIKNDTAYATISSDYDEITAYGFKNENAPADKVKIYLKNLDFKKVQVKMGKTFNESDFKSSDKFSKEKNNTVSVLFKKADSLWVAVTTDETHVYGYDLNKSVYRTYNEILVGPNANSGKIWVNRPVYITENDEIQGLTSEKNVLKYINNKQMPMLSLEKETQAYPEINGKKYYPIKRDTIFKIQQ